DGPRSSDILYRFPEPSRLREQELTEMIYVLIPLYVIVCVFLILVVLLQQGKGADVASAFGASSSQTTFGARGATTVFERITTWSFVAFSVLAIVISIL